MNLASYNKISANSILAFAISYSSNCNSNAARTIVLPASGFFKLNVKKCACISCKDKVKGLIPYFEIRADNSVSRLGHSFSEVVSILTCIKYVLACTNNSIAVVFSRTNSKMVVAVVSSFSSIANCAKLIIAFRDSGLRL